MSSVMDASNTYHVPVLLSETIDALNVREHGVYVDCTVGGGGHSEAILRRLNGTGKLIAIDRDTDAIHAATARLGERENITFVHDNFHNINDILELTDAQHVDGILIDLGVSSHQLDQAERGFSYHNDAPLDMRMDRSSGTTASEFIRLSSEDELTRVFYEYGEEKWARRIARIIKESKSPILTTGDLVRSVDAAIPKQIRAKDSGHPARRVFQALRIAINDELRPLQATLEQCVNRLKPSGRICVITFHSLEDRIVKQTFATMRKPCVCPPSFPICVCGKTPILTMEFKNPKRPSVDELRVNTRSASAMLRVGVKE